MALSFLKLFEPTLLVTSAAAIYNVPASPVTTLLRNGRVRLSNQATTAIGVGLYAVPASGATSATNNFLPAVSIAPNAAIEVDVPQLAAGDAIWGYATVSSSVNIQAMDGVLQS